MDELYTIIEEKDRIIALHAKRIVDLKNELLKVSCERDSLLEALTNSGIYRDNDDSVTPGRSSEDVLRARATASTTTNAVNNKIANQNGLVGNKRVQRQRSFKSSDTETIRRSRQSDEYELSEDIREKQIEMLEKKYGGSMRTKRAARTIQRAFRQYSMNKNFEKLRNNFGDRRVSKRLSELGRSSTVWSDRLSQTEPRITMVHAQSTTETPSGHMTRVTQAIADIETSPDFRDMPTLYRGADMSVKVLNKNRNNVIDRGRLERSMHVDASESDRRITMPQGSSHKNGPVDETNNNRNSCPEMNDSSASNSPHVTPNESAIDLTSLDFESLLENKDVEMFGDSFHGDGMYSDTSSQGTPSIPHTSQSFHRIPIHFVPSESTLNGDHHTFYDNYSMNYTNLTDSLNSQSSATMSNPGDQLPGMDNYHRTNQHAYQQHQFRVSSLDPQYQYYATHPSSSDVKLRPKNYSDPSLRSQYSATGRTSDASPVWKRKNTPITNAIQPKVHDNKRMSNISETSEPDSVDGHCYSSSPSSENVSSENTSLGSENSLVYQTRLHVSPEQQCIRPINDKLRKRLYRIGLNLFNKKPDRGINFLIRNNFIEEIPRNVARFLISRKGLSKQMIGEYLGNLLKPFNQEVLDCFCDDIDLSGLQVDLALRKFQSFFRMPGEAQKIERLMEAFAQRYCMCNPDQVKKLKSEDAIFLLAFAIIMLNTDIHNSNIKTERKMKLEDFIKNLRGIDSGDNLDRDMLVKLYDRVRQQEFRSGVDHVTQVMKVEQTIVGKKPQLALPHRRLVCYCRLYEIHDQNKKEKIGVHQREVFLFNDLLLVTKIFNKKKTGITYTFKQSLPLYGMRVCLFQNQHYQYGLRLMSNISGRLLITFNARNDHDRQKFIEDLKDAILETNGMETIRIEEELSKHRTAGHQKAGHSYINDDSRVMGYDITKTSDAAVNRLSAPEADLEQKSNLLRLLCEGEEIKRDSGGSWDSGMASGSLGSSNSHEGLPIVTSQTLPRALGKQPSHSTGNMPRSDSLQI